jgi:hypothetical protein
VVHPFHPLNGCEYDLVGYGHTWGEQRVFFREPGQTRVRSLPATWTDVGGPDPFLVVAAGRAHFRPHDLLQLARLLAELQARRCKPNSAASVKGITPNARRREASTHVQVPIDFQDEQLDVQDLTRTHSSA